MARRRGSRERNSPLILLRPAHPSEGEALTDLALRSKAYWGYDATFIGACRTELSLDPADVDRLRVVVAERAGRVIGFSALAGEPPDAELAFLFVEPDAIGTGVGRALLEHGVEVASELGFRTIRVESDPFAEPFYLRMGAVRVGEAASQSISGRTLPVLCLDVPAREIRSSRHDP